MRAALTRKIGGDSARPAGVWEGGSTPSLPIIRWHRERPTSDHMG